MFIYSLFITFFVETVQYLFTVPVSWVGFYRRAVLRSFLAVNTNGENPNSHEFCNNIQALRVINSVYGHALRGNCRGSKSSIDWEAESKPLPKRKKVRSENYPPPTKITEHQPSATTVHSPSTATTGHQLQYLLQQLYYVCHLLLQLDSNHCAYHLQ